MSTTTRRTLMKGAAWSAPAVAVSTAAPALAASQTPPCQPVPLTVDWQSGQYTRVSSSSAYYTIPLSDGTTLRMDIRSTWTEMQEGNPFGYPGDRGTAHDNLRLSQFPIGGTGQPGLILHQNDYYYQGRFGYQNVTFTFNRQVSTIDFSVTDIDADPGDFADAVRFSTNLMPTPKPELTTYVHPETGRTYYYPRTYALEDNWSGANNLTAHGENITSFDIRYANFDQYFNQGDDRDQRVFLTDFAVTIPPTGC